MKQGKKALSMPMEIIIAVVVLIVIALAVIMITTGGLTKGSKTTSEAQNKSGTGLTCQAAVTDYCARNPNAINTNGPPACGAVCTGPCGTAVFDCGRY